MPRVTFLVPCYKLGHLLPKCVTSILEQTYEDFEIIVLDDSSPDATPDVARSFKDPRVHHIRNEVNLGHLANYNQGIHRARGEYVWLISADDSLRRPYVLDRYVDLLQRQPSVGYVFCPTVRLVDEREEGVMGFTAPARTDRIFPGRAFLRDHLMVSNCVPAPSTMARKACYEQISLFPPDLPYSGDWYLWCLFALHCDVGYFADPMVYRRYHNRNISHQFWGTSVATFWMNQVAVPSRTRAAAEALGYHDVVRSARAALIREYAWQLAPKLPGQVTTACISLEEFAVSLEQHGGRPDEIREIRTGVYAGVGDRYSDGRDLRLARRFYRRALCENPRRADVWVKYFLSCLGPVGPGLREAVAAVRRRFRAARASWLHDKHLQVEQ